MLIIAKNFTRARKIIFTDYLVKCSFSCISLIVSLYDNKVVMFAINKIKLSLSSSKIDQNMHCCCFLWGVVFFCFFLIV